MESCSTLDFERLPAVLPALLSRLALPLTELGEEPMSTLSFNPEKYYLGRLCPFNHDWEETGQSLRNIKSRGCHTCSQDRLRKSRAENPDKHRQYRRDKYWRNPEKAREQARQGYWRDPDKYRQKSRMGGPIYYYANRDSISAKRRAQYQDRKEHLLAKAKEYREANKRALSERRRFWYWDDPEKYRQQKREAYARNPIVFKLNVKQWRKANRDRKNLLERRRRALKRQSRVEAYSIDQLKARFSIWGGCCAYCGQEDGLTVDHVLAIANGGVDALFNLVPACKSCNSSKSASDVLTWYRRQTFFCRERWIKIKEATDVSN